MAPLALVSPEDPRVLDVVRINDLGGKVAGCVTDNASACTKATQQVKEHLPPAAGRRCISVGCFEHAGQLIAKDIFAKLPHLVKAIDHVSKVHAMVSKSKRLRTAVWARLGKLHRVRKTRFNSRLHVVKSYLKHSPRWAEVKEMACYKDHLHQFMHD